MSAADDGGPAFPVADAANLQPRTLAELKRAVAGMTLRDYFASAAIQGLVASLGEDADLDKPKSATWCYEVADAMLKAREVRS